MRSPFAAFRAPSRTTLRETESGAHPTGSLFRPSTRRRNEARSYLSTPLQHPRWSATLQRMDSSGRNRMKLFMSVILSLAVTGVPLAAQLYRWVDDKGNVEYRDTPPPQNAKKVE